MFVLGRFAPSWTWKWAWVAGIKQEFSLPGSHACHLIHSFQASHPSLFYLHHTTCGQFPTAIHARLPQLVKCDCSRYPDTLSRPPFRDRFIAPERGMLSADYLWLSVISGCVRVVEHCLAQAHTPAGVAHGQWLVKWESNGQVVVATFRAVLTGLPLASIRAVTEEWPQDRALSNKLSPQVWWQFLGIFHFLNRNITYSNWFLWVVEQCLLPR